MVERYQGASLKDLFEADESPSCGVCGDTLDALDALDDGSDEGHAVQGRGMLLWSRGEERRTEDVPLCPTCSAGIGITALSRFQLEEEEG